MEILNNFISFLVYLSVFGAMLSGSVSAIGVYGLFNNTPLEDYQKKAILIFFTCLSFALAYGL